MEIKRREFLLSLGGCSAFFLGGVDLLAAKTLPDLVVVDGRKNDLGAARLFREGIDRMGGIGRFVKKGEKVLVKPDIAWNRPPEFAANTNPALVAEIVARSYSAGAAEVVVFDHTCDDWRESYRNSGIAQAVVAVGGRMVPGNEERDYREVAIGGQVLKKAKIHRAVIECDTWFNVPVVKVHPESKMSIGMKNLMGVVWDRQYFFREGLDRCIAELCAFLKPPTLNVVDAYRILKSNGPKGHSQADTVFLNSLVISSDLVAAEIAAVNLARPFTNVGIEEVRHIGIGSGE